MKKSQRVCAALICITCITMLAIAPHYALRGVVSPSIESAPSESELSAETKIYWSSLLAPGAPYHEQPDPLKEPARKKRAWKLYQLCLARHERDVTEQVMPFLQDEYALLRNTAARLLGRLENPAAEQPLQERSYRLAVARNRTRGLKRQAKVTAFAKEMSLSFDQVVHLAQTLRAERLKSRGSGSEGEKIVKEIVDMLCVMGKRGEDIEPLVQRLSLHPAQRVLLQGAALPPDEEAQLIVDYLARLDVVTPEDTELAELYLPSLGASATKAAVRNLERIKESPSQWGQRGYAALFSFLRWSGDARALALAKHFEKSEDHWVHHYAGLSRIHMELLGKWSSFSSPNPPTMGPMFSSIQ